MLSAFKNFFVTFVVAALIFGCAAYVAVQFLTSTISDILEDESGELEALLQPAATTATATDEPPVVDIPTEVIAGESFNMVLIVTDYQPDVFSDYLPTDADLEALVRTGAPTVGVLNPDYRRIRSAAVLLFRADKERHEFTVTSFPSNMQVYTASGPQNFGDLYNLYGRAFIVDKVAAITGIPIHYSLLINVTELYDVVKEIGGVSMNIQKDLYFNGKVSTTIKPEDTNALPVLLRIGKRTVDGTGAMAIVMNEEYPGTVVERNTMLCDLFRAIMTKLTSFDEDRLRKVYSKFLDSAWIDTNFTLQDLGGDMEMLKKWSDESFTVTQLDYPGVFISASERAEAHYDPNLTAGMELFRKYKPILKTEETAGTAQ